MSAQKYIASASAVFVAAILFLFTSMGTRTAAETMLQTNCDNTYTTAVCESSSGTNMLTSQKTVETTMCDGTVNCDGTVTQTVSSKSTTSNTSTNNMSCITNCATETDCGTVTCTGTQDTATMIGGETRTDMMRTGGTMTPTPTRVSTGMQVATRTMTSQIETGECTAACDNCDNCGTCTSTCQTDECTCTYGGGSVTA